MLVRVSTAPPADVIGALHTTSCSSSSVPRVFDGLPGCRYPRRDLRDDDRLRLIPGYEQTGHKFTCAKNVNVLCESESNFLFKCHLISGDTQRVLNDAQLVFARASPKQPDGI